MYWRGGGIGHTTPHRPGAFNVSPTLYMDAGVQPSDLGDEIVIEDEVIEEANDIDMQFICELQTSVGESQAIDDEEEEDERTEAGSDAGEDGSGGEED